jgi:hypothetical protein
MGMIKKVIKKGIKKLKKVFIPRSEFLEDKKVKEPKLQPAYINFNQHTLVFLHQMFFPMIPGLGILLNLKEHSISFRSKKKNLLNNLNKKRLTTYTK